MRWLDAAIRATKATIVVLDTIQSLVNTVDPNKAEQVAPFMVRLHRLRDAHGLVIFPVHHTSKAPTDAKTKIRSKADTMLGSQAWRALSDGVIMIDAADGDASDAEIRLIKGKDIETPPAPVRVTMEALSKRFRPLDDGEEAPVREDVRKGGRPKTDLLSNVLALRSQHVDGVEWSGIEAHIGVSRSRWYERRDEVHAALLNLGHVVVGGRLRWKVEPAEGSEVEMTDVF